VGLDSSSIVCMADDHFSERRSTTPYLDTLSYYDKTEPNGDDWIYFPKIEERRGRVGAHIDASKLGSSPTSLDYPEFSVLPGYLVLAVNSKRSVPPSFAMQIPSRPFGYRWR